MATSSKLFVVSDVIVAFLLHVQAQYLLAHHLLAHLRLVHQLVVHHLCYLDSESAVPPPAVRSAIAGPYPMGSVDQPQTLLGQQYHYQLPWSFCDWWQSSWIRPQTPGTSSLLDLTYSLGPFFYCVRCLSIVESVEFLWIIHFERREKICGLSKGVDLVDIQYFFLTSEIIKSFQKFSPVWLARFKLNGWIPFTLALQKNLWSFTLDNLYLSTIQNYPKTMIFDHLEGYLLSDENIPGGVEDGLIAVGLPIWYIFVRWPSTLLIAIWYQTTFQSSYRTWMNHHASSIGTFVKG